MSNPSKQWTAEWWLNCLGCNQEKVIDGRTANDRYETLKRDGYKKIGDVWLCRSCAQAYEFERETEVGRETVPLVDWLKERNPAGT